MNTIENNPNTTSIKDINTAGSVTVVTSHQNNSGLVYKDTAISPFVEFSGIEILKDKEVCNYDEFIFNRSRDEIVDMIFNSQPTPGFNLMGCSESWYDAFYAISRTFTEEYIRTRSELELKALLALGATISTYLY